MEPKESEYGIKCIKKGNTYTLFFKGNEIGEIVYDVYGIDDAIDDELDDAITEFLEGINLKGRFHDLHCWYRGVIREAYYMDKLGVKSMTSNVPRFDRDHIDFLQGEIHDYLRIKNCPVSKENILETIGRSYYGYIDAAVMNRKIKQDVELNYFV